MAKLSVIVKLEHLTFTYTLSSKYNAKRCRNFVLKLNCVRRNYL